MSRLPVLSACGAFALATFAVVVPVVTSSAVAAAAADPSVDSACPGTLSGSTFTLAADCDTTLSLTVPDGQTVDGAGHTITAHDPGVGQFFTGSVLINAGTSMNIE